MSSLHRALHQFAVAVSKLNENNVYQESQFNEFMKKLKQNSLDYPAIYFSEVDCYYASENQKEVDLRNQIKANSSISIEILSNNIDDIITLEESFTNILYCDYELKNVSDISDVACAYLALNKEIKPKRKTLPNGGYISQISAYCYNFILPKYIENPIRFELSHDTQVKVLKHLYLLESMYHKLLDKNNRCNDVNSKAIIEKQITQIQKQISEMFIFKDLCSENFSHTNHSFQYCYQLLTDKKSSSDIKAIIHLNEQRIKKEKEKKKQAADEKAKKEKMEAEKKERLRAHFSKVGDTQLNRYTDAVIQDLKDNLSLNNISVYGGSTFNKWYKKYEDGTISFPNILIMDAFNYDLELKSYKNKTANGDISTHEYDTSSLPVKYGFLVSIFSDSLEQNKEIEKRIVNRYSNKKQIKISDYKYPNEFTIIDLQISPNTQIEREHIENKYRTIISFNPFKNVFYACGYNADECKNNQRQQLRLLQQAEYVFIKLSNYTEAKKQLSSYYKPLVERKNSLFGFLNSTEYKQVKSLYNSGMPISKVLFDSAMESVIKYYPDLYQQFINGWSYSQIENEINGYVNYYRSRFKLLMNLLSIPEHSAKNLFYPHEVNYHTQEALIYLIEKMLDPYCELNSALKKYTTKKCKEITAQQERDRLERERRAAMRAEREYESSSSSGGSIFETAAGVFIGNKMSNKTSKTSTRNEKRDLLGTTVCQYGKRDKHGFIRYCPGCPVNNKCSRY